MVYLGATDNPLPARLTYDQLKVDGEIISKSMISPSLISNLTPRVSFRFTQTPLLILRDLSGSLWIVCGHFVYTGSVRIVGMMGDRDRCVVAIRTPIGIVKAFDICIRGEDVYTNYSDTITPEAHASYHKSGQYHFKKGKRYIEWDGGPTGEMEPMRVNKIPPGRVRGRIRFWTGGWEVPNLSSELPPLDGDADLIVDATHLDADSILAFEAYVIGQEATALSNIVGYPIIAWHRFGTSPLVEICSFVVRGEPDDSPANL